jgi:hypothetical protein
MDLTGVPRLLAVPWRRAARWLRLGASGERLIGYENVEPC